jgi:dihydrodipicolinate synthase/N-acetylneuraminate lyase
VSSRGSRFSQLKSYSELVKIHRAIADAKEAADADRATDIRAEREETRVMLGSHGLFMASVATGAGATPALDEYRKLNQRMREGGYHAARRRAGGVLDK